MLVRFLASAAALAVATWLLPGITLSDGDNWNRAMTMLLVAAIFGIVNSLIKPLFKFVAAPVIFLTLGFFLLVINALLLELVSWASGEFGLGWHVADWGSAFWGALIVSIVSFLLNAPFKKGEVHR
ncbi:phage holin family protein [Propionicimonas sp.]|uniref:phage holin family protein n=1 Tax=Propionicimonas sp. TaxID=1955623 RepID=UPI0039E5503F